MPLTLGRPIESSSRPRFEADLDGRPAIVELDSGAVFKLADHATGKALTRLLEGRHERIQSAAARLAEQGFLTDVDGVVEILVTALDL